LLRDAAITGSAIQLRDSRRLSQLPDEGVFAPTTT
jgi:hypothetical protein